MTTQPEALRLAEWLDSLDVRTPDRIQNCVSAAAELRRLHEANQELLEALENVAALKRRDPCKGRSNAGRWVALNATAELMEKVDALMANAEGRA